MAHYKSKLLTYVLTAFHPFGMVNQAFLSGFMVGHIRLCRVAGNIVWSPMAGDAPWLWDGFPV